MNTQELLWKYAEGQCSGHEKDEVEKLLASDENAKDELRLIQEIHASLSGLEAEQPSMRFAQNVMESLPKKLYANIGIEPLLPSYLKVIFWSILSGIFIILVFISKTRNPTNKELPYNYLINESIEMATKLISSDMLLYAVLIFISLATLAIFDRFLARGKFTS